MTRLFRSIALFVFPLAMLAAAPLLHAANDKASELAGAALFRDKGCSYCHGPNVQGTTRGPSLVKVRKKLKPAQMATQILDGGQRMPPFSDSLSEIEVKQLVSYLRAKKRPNPPAPLAKAAAAPSTLTDSKPMSNPEQ